MGGTCVNVGCVPKKLYVYASEFSHAFTDSKGFGWDAAAAGFDWATLRDNKKDEISRLNGIYRNMLAGVEVDTIDGRGGDDFIYADAVDDFTDISFNTLNGGDGDDTLIAGASDVLTGGDGADQLLLGDWIAQGTVDLIDFDRDEDQLLLVYNGTEAQPSLEVEADPNMPGQTIVRLDGEEAMRLTGAEGLTADDIILVEASDEDVAYLPIPT